MARDLNDTLVFVKVVEQGSFIAAAKTLRLPKTTVSRKVQELETRLGAQLLHRTTRKLGLTEAGNVYYEHSQRIARELDEAESAVTQLQGGPRGWLRITAPYSLGIERIAPLLGEFHARHPEVRVEMLLSNEPLDLIDREIDVALRVGNLPDSNLIARRLASFRQEPNTRTPRRAKCWTAARPRAPSAPATRRLWTTRGLEAGGVAMRNSRRLRPVDVTVSRAFRPGSYRRRDRGNTRQDAPLGRPSAVIAASETRDAAARSGAR